MTDEKLRQQLKERLKRYYGGMKYVAMEAGTHREYVRQVLSGKRKGGEKAAKILLAAARFVSEKEAQRLSIEKHVKKAIAMAV